MISFRYHIVTITAVFLALALGFVLGAAIRPTEQAVRTSLNDLRSDRDQKRAQIVDLRGQLQQANDIGKNLSTRVIRGALVGRQVVYVDDGTDNSWQGRVRKAMADATANDVGTLTLTDKWTEAGATSELRRIALDAGIEGASSDAAENVMRVVGEQFGKPPGARLVAELQKAGFVKVDAKTSGAWPPQGASVLTLTSGPATTPEASVIAAFATGTAKATAVLVVADNVDELGAVAILRDGATRVPARLATFDSASTDGTGAGSVLALSAAIDGRGGNFGTAPGLSYLPPI